MFSTVAFESTFFFIIKQKRVHKYVLSQSVEKPEIQENWISGLDFFIIKVAKYENAEEELS